MAFGVYNEAREAAVGRFVLSMKAGFKAVGEAPTGDQFTVAGTVPRGSRRGLERIGAKHDTSR
jgi:hypothetical protein